MRSLIELYRDWDLVVPDAFFFEVASTDSDARDRCLRKLRQLHDEGGVRIAPNVGEMLHKEIQGLHSAGVPSDNLIRGMDLDGLFGMTFEDLSTARRDALLQTETGFSRDIDALAVAMGMLGRRCRIISGPGETTACCRRIESSPSEPCRHGSMRLLR